MNIHKHCSYEDWKRNRWGFDWRAICPAPIAICEVGVGPLSLSMLPYYDDLKPTAYAIEPNPAMASACRRALPWVNLTEKAVWSKSGDHVTLQLNNGSSGITGQWCPTPGGQGTVQVETTRFSDSVSWVPLDILNLDCEGSEHYALEDIEEFNMPRPRYIGIELWPRYPKAAYCEQWLLRNKYRPIFATGPSSETSIWRLE